MRTNSERCVLIYLVPRVSVTVEERERANSSTEASRARSPVTLHKTNEKRLLQQLTYTPTLELKYKSY